MIKSRLFRTETPLESIIISNMINSSEKKQNATTRLKTTKYAKWKKSAK